MATKKTVTKKTTTERYVLLRARDAGVWAGVFEERTGERSVKLGDGRRIWRWRGALTLSEVSQRGIEPASKGHTRVACPVPSTEILEVCEIHDCSSEARASIEAAGWAP